MRTDFEIFTVVNNERVDLISIQIYFNIIRKSGSPQLPYKISSITN